MVWLFSANYFNWSEILAHPRFNFIADHYTIPSAVGGVGKSLLYTTREDTHA